MTLPKRVLHYLPRGSLLVTALCVCSAVIVFAIFYLIQGASEADGKGGVSETGIATQKGTIAELRRLQTADDMPVFAQADSNSNSEHVGEPHSSDEQNAELAHMQEKLEALAMRMEERLSQLEMHLKRAQFIPLTREENQAEVQRLEKVLKEARLRGERAGQEVRRLAKALNVPEAVTKLSPDEGISDPRYALFRPYFEARRAAAYTERVIAAAASAYGDLAVKSY